ncbi:MAG: hypothetical protein ACOVLB_07865 [Candidatus Nanopelagicus sp.]
MSKGNEVIEEFEEDSYEDWQYEQSGTMASEFIESVVMPLVNEFDFGNDDEDYIYGTATFGLFIELLPLLGQLGYDKDDLIDQVNLYINYVSNKTLH